MRDDLRPGLEYHFAEDVTPDLSPPHLAPIVVLSTPSMVRLMEEASFRCVHPYLENGQSTVGTHINVSHRSAARLGETVSVTARLSSIDQNRLNFDVSVVVGDRVVGEGTHQRAIIERDRFG